MPCSEGVSLGRFWPANFGNRNYLYLSRPLLSPCRRFGDFIFRYVFLFDPPGNKGGKPRDPQTGTKMEPVDTLPTYKEIKLDKKLASQAQKLASVDEELVPALKALS